MVEGKAGRVALVTGAGGPGGMGATIAWRFAQDGMAVGILDINGGGAETVAAEIVAASGRAIDLAADVSDRAQVQAAVHGTGARACPRKQCRHRGMVCV